LQEGHRAGGVATAAGVGVDDVLLGADELVPGAEEPVPGVDVLVLGAAELVLVGSEVEPGPDGVAPARTPWEAGTR
jgi:hypothetical protein